MKNKLYKLNRKSHFNLFRKAGIVLLSAFTLSVFAAIPLSIALNFNDSVEVKTTITAESPFDAKDFLELHRF